MSALTIAGRRACGRSLLLAWLVSSCATGPAPDPASLAAALGDELELRVTRSVDRRGRSTGRSIGLAEWLRYVAAAPDLRLRTEPFAGRNPKSGESIEIPVGEGVSELLVDGHPVPFLAFYDGELALELEWLTRGADDPVLSAVLAVARHFDAVVVERGGGAVLGW